MHRYILSTHRHLPFPCFCAETTTPSFHSQEENSRTLLTCSSFPPDQGQYHQHDRQKHYHHTHRVRQLSIGLPCHSEDKGQQRQPHQSHFFHLHPLPFRRYPEVRHPEPLTPPSRKPSPGTLHLSRAQKPLPTQAAHQRTGYGHAPQTVASNQPPHTSGH